MNWYKRAKQDIVFENVHLDYAYGQNDYALLAKFQEAVVGKINYSEFEDILHISYIVVAPEFRRQGIGTALIRELERLNKTEFEGKPIRWGLLTNEGSKFKGSLNRELV